jgi:hypothetical protein
MHPPGKRSMDININININKTVSICAGGRGICHPSTITHLHLSARRRVECGAGVPGAGHSSRREWSTSGHSAATRAGTVNDGQNQQIDST